ESEYPGMPLLAHGRKGHAARRRIAGYAREFPEPNDISNLQRLRHEPVQKNRAGHSQPRRSKMETRHAFAPAPAYRRGDIAPGPRPCPSRRPPRTIAHRETR